VAAADDVLVQHVLPADPRAAGLARRAVRAALAGTVHDQHVDAAELAVSEVVTNATLHAHTSVELSILLGPERLRVEVLDHNPTLPLQRRYGEQATTGRGMALVGAVTSSCGVTRVAGGKVVWFVLEAAPAEVSEEDLLAAFDDAQWDLDDASRAPSPQEEPAPAGPEHPAVPAQALRRVRLLGIPPTLWLAADQHHDTLLRELALYLSHRRVAGSPAAPRQRDAAEADLGGVDLALTDSGRHTVSRALVEAVERRASDGTGEVLALPAGHPSPLRPAPATVDLELTLPPETGAAMAALQDALDAAERLAASGHLLAFPGQPEVVAVRDWVTEQVQAQLSGVAPTPWAGTDHQRFESSRERSEGLDAISAAVAFVLTDPRGVVAADEGNRIVAVSQVLATALGWDAHDLVGRRVVALIPPALREAHVAGFTRHLTTGQAHVLGTPLTLPVLRADGTQVECGFMIEQVPAPTGRSLYLAWVDPHEPAATTPAAAAATPALTAPDGS
jgi:PAS domain S-box-containing protein